MRQGNLEKTLRFGLIFPTPGNEYPNDENYLLVNTRVGPDGQVLEFLTDLVITSDSEDPELFIDAMLSFLSYGLNVWDESSNAQLPYHVDNSGQVVVSREAINSAIKEGRGCYYLLRERKGQIKVGWDGENNCQYRGL